MAKTKITGRQAKRRINPIKKDNKSKTNKKISITLLFLLGVLLSVFITETAYILYKVKYVRVFNAKFEAKNDIGFAIGKQEIDFGIVPSGSFATRYIDAENQGSRNITARVFVFGNIKRFISYDNAMTIIPGETRQITFIVSSPEGIKEMQYTGKIFLIFERA